MVLQRNLQEARKVWVIDEMSNINDIVNMYQQMRSNPMQMLSQKFNIPQNVNQTDPNEILQHLLNTGQVTQSQVNQANAMKNNPLLQQLMNRY